jgi:ribonuclease VapC
VIVVDSSAIIAIFRQENDAAHYAQRIAADADPIMSAANVVETSIVLRGLKKIPSDKADGLMTSLKRQASGSKL